MELSSIAAEAEADSPSPSEREQQLFDAFGFPVDQQYIPTSLCAPLTPHMHQWARYWAQMTADGTMPETLPPNRRLRQLVSGGVPCAFRGCVWSLLLRVPERRRRSPANHYRALLDGGCTSAADEEAASQIGKDADRTWPRHRWLDVGALQRVLTALSRHCKDVGYCQGLNSVAATFLLFQKEEEAFWCLVQLIEARFPAGYWGSTLWRSNAEQEVLKALLRRREPKLMRRLDKAQLVLELFSTQWLVCLFVTDLPLESALRVWDLICLSSDGVGGSADASAFLLSAGLGLVRAMRPLLSRCRSPAALCEAMRIGPAQIQPGELSGAQFLVHQRDAMAWLQSSVPLRALRSAAIAKVTAQLELVQAVREGRAGPEQLHSPKASLRGSDADVSVPSSLWWRQRLRSAPTPSLKWVVRSSHLHQLDEPRTPRGRRGGAAIARARQPAAPTAEDDAREMSLRAA